MPNIKVAEVLGGGVANVDKKEVADRTQADTNFLHGDGVFPVRDANGLLNAENAKVQAQSPAAMAVDVLDGLALVDGFTLGNRTVGGSVAASVAVTAADPTNPRIDIVVVSPPDNGSGNRVNSGEFKNATFEVIAGTPAATPVAPSAPDGKILLAKVTVGAGATTITDADIKRLSLRHR
jgi:hypothetical protein